MTQQEWPRAECRRCRREQEARYLDEESGLCWDCEERRITALLKSQQMPYQPRTRWEEKSSQRSRASSPRDGRKW